MCFVLFGAWSSSGNPSWIPGVSLCFPTCLWFRVTLAATTALYFVFIKVFLILPPCLWVLPAPLGLTLKPPLYDSYSARNLLLSPAEAQLWKNYPKEDTTKWTRKRWGTDIAKQPWKKAGKVQRYDINVQDWEQTGDDQRGWITISEIPNTFSQTPSE